jgi:hypothetical protein
VKYNFVINQAGVVRSGLLGRVDLAALCVLDYIGGWIFCAKAKRVIVDGREFVWLCYGHAVEELPLLLNPKAAVETRKNQLSRLVRNLRDAGLVESVRVGRDLYLRPSALAASLVSSREANVTKSAPTVTPLRDNTPTPSHDDAVTPSRDDSSSTIIDETTITETYTKEAAPLCPPSGERDCGPVSHSSSPIEEIYAVYPRKVGKPAALCAIKKALKTHSAELLLARTKLFAATYNGDPQYIPNPSTWFRQERYIDDPSTWTRPAHGWSLSRNACKLNRLGREDFLLGGSILITGSL